MKVFISHKKEDTAIANEIAIKLLSSRLDCYLNVIDIHLKESGQNFAGYIRSQLEKCTQLIAVIGAKTHTYWWVPWEIGLATEKERFLASFVADAVPVPEYLLKWPYLRSMDDIDEYIEVSKASQLIVENGYRTGREQISRSLAFKNFHTDLKARLFQK